MNSGKHFEVINSATGSAATTVIDELRGEFYAARDQMKASTWPDGYGDFIEQVGRADDLLAPHQRLVHGWTAQLLETAYREGTASGKQILSVFEEQELPPLLSHTPLESYGGKRQPSLVESVPATIERLGIIEQIPTLFDRNVGGVMLSGSMSYGAFFNVRGKSGLVENEHWNSDIDLVLAFNDKYQNVPGWGSLLESDVFNEQDRESFLRRIQHFKQLHEQGQADIFTHRFDVANADFNVGIHCLPPHVLKNLFNDRLQEDLVGGMDTVFQLKDYKPTPFRRSHCTEHGFDGSKAMYEVPEQEIVMDGVVAALSGYMIADGKLYPGLWQSMLLPEFMIVQGDTHARTVVESYRQTLIERLLLERKTSPGASLLKAHVRHKAFAPGRYNELGVRV